MGKIFSNNKPPAPPDPNMVINRQNQQNRQQTQQQAAYNRPDQTNRFGTTQSWRQIGVDANGNPQFELTQQLGDQGQQYAQGLGQLGQQYFAGANRLINDGTDLSGDHAFDRAYEYATGNLEPRFERARTATESRLRNQGLDPTSEAYRNQMNDLALQQNEARNSLVTGLQNQMFNQGQTERNRQLREFMGLTQPGLQFGNLALGSEMPGFQGVNVGNVDVAGIYNNNFNQQMANYNAQQAQRNAMLSGVGSLIGLGANVLMPGSGSALQSGMSWLGNTFGTDPWPR